MIARLLNGLPCWIAAEHGYVIRLGWPGDGQDEKWSEWKEVTPDPEVVAGQNWLEICGEIFQHYARRTPGAMVETTRVSMSLHIEDADREYAASIARQLLSTLSETTAGLPIKTHLGKRSVDVIHVAVSKGAAVSLAIDHLNDIIKENLDDVVLNEEVLNSTIKQHISQDGDELNLEQDVATDYSSVTSQHVNGDNSILCTPDTGSGICSIICILTGSESSDESVFTMLRNVCDVVFDTVFFQEKIVRYQSRISSLNMVPSDGSAARPVSSNSNGRLNETPRPAPPTGKDLLTPQSNHSASSNVFLGDEKHASTSIQANSNHMLFCVQ